VLKRSESDPTNRDQLEASLNQRLPVDWTTQRFVLHTGHRRENFGDSFLAICDAIRQLAATHPDVPFVCPVHLSPSIQKPVYNLISGHANIHMIDPLEYQSFVFLLKHTFLVLTDSGGIQEEAPSLGKPALVMREVTERPEVVEAGTVRLVGADAAKIVHRVSALLTD
jgi:UDP-N-acetylglucosamine 2-epimerase (non-hydrolysing)